MMGEQTDQKLISKTRIAFFKASFENSDHNKIILNHTLTFALINI